MLSASVAVQDTIKKALAIFATPRVIAEWNHNRYSSISIVDNWGSSTEAINAFDLDFYPIESIVEPLRPTSGILIAKTNEGAATKGFNDLPDNARSYTASVDSKYKHWTSQVASTSSTSGGGFAIDSTGANPYVIYDDPVWANKIYLCFEISWAKPVNYTVEVTTNGTVWTTAAIDVVPALDGTVSLYLQSDGGWTTTVARNTPIQIKGVKITVHSLNKANAYLNLVEMGLRLEQDLTPYLKTYNLDYEVSDDDIVSPVGDISSNTGTVSLSNLDGRFNNDPPAGVDATPWYRGIIDANTKIIVDLGIDTSQFGGAGVEYLRQGTLFADIWAVNDESADISLKDASKFLQEINPLDFLIAAPTLGSAIWQLLDSIGFNYFAYDHADENSVTNINYFWATHDQTVWDIIKSLCRTMQSTVYFDVFGILQIKTPQELYSATKAASPDWTLDDKLNGTKRPDIVSLTENASFNVNKVNVVYKPTDVAVDALNRPIRERVWTPQDDIVLRCSGLRNDMSDTQMYFNLDGSVAQYWPYEGMVNIRGELIKYSGKEYRYINKSGAWQTTVLTNSDDKIHVDQVLSDPHNSWQNNFSGKMIITERGYDWTIPRSHDTTIQSWLDAGPTISRSSGSTSVWTGGLHHIKTESLMRMTTNSSFGTNDTYAAPQGTRFGQPSTNLGTRFRIPSSPTGTTNACGVFWHSNSAKDTYYYVDIVTTASIISGDLRAVRNEVQVRKRINGVDTSLNGIGVAAGIAADVWYDIDIVLIGDAYFIMLNGLPLITVSDTSIAHSDILGPVVRGNSVAEFEYFYYASSGGWPDEDDDNSSYLDIIRGGYYSNQFFVNGYYRTRTHHRKKGRRTITYKQRYANRFFDEFGILVHEVRQFNVDFDKAPVVDSTIFISGPDQVVILDYTPTPFSAQFTLANATRQNAIVNGEDNLTYAGHTVNRQAFVYGRTIQQKEDVTITKTNDQEIKARGEISLDISSDWLQTAGAAGNLADWITTQWGVPADQIDVEVFGNPLVELGDVVSVNYSPRNMIDTTHRYFVLKVSHDYENGLGTTLSLRRAA